VREARQPHLRGGVREPLGHAEITAKFRANATYGGWPQSRIDRLETWCDRAFEQGDLGEVAAVRS
jgi:hypothetical protein